MSIERSNLTLLIGHETFAVPVTFQKRFSREHLTDLGIMHVFSFPGTECHNFDQDLKRRTHFIDRAIFQIPLCNGSVCICNVLDTFQERRLVLTFGLQDVVLEDISRVVEDTTEISPNESLGNSVTQSAAGNQLAIDRAVFQFFETLFLNQEIWLLFFGG